MTGAVGFAASLTEFALTKLIGKKIDLSLDDKKRAARAFLELYESMQTLEQSLASIEEQLDNVVSGREKRLFAVRTEAAINQIQIGTNAFLGAINKLETVIKIYDSTLAEMLYRVKTGKLKMFGVFTLQGEYEMKLVWGDPNYVFSLEISKVNEISKSKLQRIYDAIPNLRKTAMDSRYHFSPDERQKCLEMARTDCGLSSNVITYEVASNDVENISSILSNLREHRASLSSSMRQLADFIRSRFSLEDLLR